MGDIPIFLRKTLLKVLILSNPESLQIEDMLMSPDLRYKAAFSVRTFPRYVLIFILNFSENIRDIRDLLTLNSFARASLEMGFE